MSSPTVVVSRFISWRTRLRSVRNSKDLITRTVRVASVGGRVRFVKTSEISPSVDMVRTEERRLDGQEALNGKYLLY